MTNFMAHYTTHFAGFIKQGLAMVVSLKISHRYLHVMICLMMNMIVLPLAFAQSEPVQKDIIADPDTKRRIVTGEVLGFKALSGAHVWRAIPYGATTAGDNRWRAPRPAPMLNGVHDGTRFAERCPQIATPFNEIENVEYGTLVGSEDCLKLDIYAPSSAVPNNRENPLPVMVWIHGGANVSGSSEIYDGSKLAQAENVILVEVQYRLGPLGYFSNGLLRESALDPLDKAANFGTLDLIAALKWVQDNVAAFGGNKNNVTIFGQSAGGHNVVTLLASPLAKDLFHRAIIQSGSFDSVSILEAEGKTGDRVNPSDEIVNSLIGAKALGGHIAQSLRAISIDDLFKAYDNGSGSLDLPTIIQDGVTIPKTPLRDVFASAENFNAVPIMTGINRDEMKLYQVFDDRLTKKRFGQFFVARNSKFYDLASDYTSRVWRIRSVDMPAMLMAAGDFDNVYAYRFDWDDGGSFLFTNTGKMLGAAHGMEIPFVFNHYKLFGAADKIIFKKKSLESRTVLSQAMGRYWATFARDGRPQGAGLPSWPPYKDGNFLVLDSVRNKKKEGGIYLKNSADSLERLTNDLRDDQRLNDKQRCQIARGIVAWLPSLETIIQSTGCS